MSAAKTFVIETYGCQMNVHDSERIAGLLLNAGYEQALEGSDPDLVVFNTCAVRENADNKLYGRLSFLAPRKRKDKDFQIAVGGCMAQKDQATIIKRAPYVDVVFGTHNIGSLPVLLERSRIEEAAQVEIKEALEHFPSTLPSRRHSPFSAWVSISVGCNNTCTFCIVPQLRGPEKDRDEKDIVREAQTLVDQGVIEITLLGQNVNAYHGLDESGHPASLGHLLTYVSQVSGIKRIRYTTSHPLEMDENLANAHRDIPAVMPYLHLPVQSGSDKILSAMNRRHKIKDYHDAIAMMRRKRPDIAFSSDFIVGFPGETDEDFKATLSLVEQVGFASAYTFKYSVRPGTPASEMDDQISEEVKDQRLHRLQALIAQQQRAYQDSMHPPWSLAKGGVQDRLCCSHEGSGRRGCLQVLGEAWTAGVGRP